MNNYKNLNLVCCIASSALPSLRTPALLSQRYVPRDGRSPNRDIGLKRAAAAPQLSQPYHHSELPRCFATLRSS